VTDRPTRFKRPVLLIVGCGDIGLRVVALLTRRWRVLALTSTPARVAALRAAGVVPLRGDLDVAASLARLAALADAVLHLAPPASNGARDLRTAHLLHALARSRRLGRIVYASTTGVYGDRAGAATAETAPARPATDRARRRADAEERVRRFGRRHRAAATVLRVPGIYALDRAGGDFARPRPPRVSRAEAAARLSPLQMSFLAESRRLVNERMKRELRVVLRHPTVTDGLAERR
jgi:nucleoside-diphosphate-sugar epimerase